MGPLTQCIFTLIVWLEKIDVPLYFYHYHMFILIFNLLPIYPLDGGRLVNLLLASIFSYYQSLKVILYFSILSYSIISFSILIFHWNLLYFFIIILLGTKIYKEIGLADYYFQKFLIERYFNNYPFHKIKTISSFKQMKRDYYHYFVYHQDLYSEKKVLNDYFLNRQIV